MPEEPEQSESGLRRQQIQAAISDDSLPQIYFNGFINVLSAGDVFVILQNQGRCVAKLNMSYTLAKTLSQKLGNMIASLEEQSGNKIMTTEDVQKATEKM